MNHGLALVEQEGQASSVMEGEFFLADEDTDADSRAEGERGEARDVDYNHQKENTCPNVTSSIHNEPKTPSKIDNDNASLPLKYHPLYKEFFDMLKLGYRRKWVEDFIVETGLNKKILELDPNLPLAGQHAEIEISERNQEQEQTEQCGQRIKNTNINASPSMGTILTKRAPISSHNHGERDAIDGQSDVIENKAAPKKVTILHKRRESSRSVDKNEFRDLFTAQVVQGHNVNCVSSAALKKKNTAQILSSKRGLIGGVILSAMSYECSMLEKMVDSM